MTGPSSLGTISTFFDHFWRVPQNSLPLRFQRINECPAAKSSRSFGRDRGPAGSRRSH
jgi:hypothetical protein